MPSATPARSARTTGPLSTLRRLTLSSMTLSSMAAPVIAIGLALSGASALAQNAEPVPTPPEPAQAEPWTPTWTDGEIANLAGMLTGAWRSDAPVSDGAAGVHLVAHIGPVSVPGVENALYAEFARADDLDDPYYQAIFSVFRAGSKLRLRTYEFRLPSRNLGALVGIWAAPELMPNITAEEHLLARMDIELSPSADGYSGMSPYPFPTNRGGAIEMRSEFGISPDAAAWTDRGYNAQGQVVWGPPEGETTTFSRIESPLTVMKMDRGLVVIDYNMGDSSIVHADGDGVDVHYAGWIPSTHLFQTSRDRGQSFRIPRLPVPSGLLQGWNIGVPGIAQGGTRRLFIPAELGYGERGQPAAGIGPNSNLYFRVDALFVVKPEVVTDADPESAGPTPEGPASEGQDGGS